MSNGDPFYQPPGTLEPLDPGGGGRDWSLALPSLGPSYFPGGGKGGGNTMPSRPVCFQPIPSEVRARFQQYPQTPVGNDLSSALALPFTRDEVIRAVKNAVRAVQLGPAGPCGGVSSTDFHVASAVRDILNTRVCRGWLKFSVPPKVAKRVVHLGEQLSRLVPHTPLPGVSEPSDDSLIYDLDFVGTTFDDSRRSQPVGPGYPSGPFMAPGTTPQGPGQPSISGPPMTPELLFPRHDAYLPITERVAAPRGAVRASPPALLGGGLAGPPLERPADELGANLSNLQAANFFPIHNAYSIKGED